MKKEPFVTKAQLDEIIKTYPTPIHLYDEYESFKRSIFVE